MSKTKKIRGKVYTMHGWDWTKSESNLRAKKRRKEGYSVYVTKTRTPVGYALWERMPK